MEAAYSQYSSDMSNNRDFLQKKKQKVLNASCIVESKPSHDHDQWHIFLDFTWGGQ